MNVEDFLDKLEEKFSKASSEDSGDTQKRFKDKDGKTYTIETEWHTNDSGAFDEDTPKLSTVEEPPASEHYQTGIDPITYGEVNLSSERMAGFYQMNVLKYVTRYQRKNGVEDLQKAKFYLNKLIELENQ